jgi:hypothetical protein
LAPGKEEATVDPVKLQGMMAEAQKMAARLQEEMARRTAEGEAGGGMVKAQVNGHGDLVRLKIDPQAVDPRDVTMLEDLVVAAVAQAQARIREQVSGEASKLMGMLPPGFPGL